VIPGYDDYHERIQRGESAYTTGGLINKINAMQDEIYAAQNQVDPYRDDLTALLKMEWVGGVCPDDNKIIAAVKEHIDAQATQLAAKDTEIRKLKEVAIEERARSYWLYEQIDSNVFWDMWEKENKTRYMKEAAKELDLSLGE
jgi:hypothetical protein